MPLMGAMKKQTAFAHYRKSTGKTLDEVAADFGVDRTTILRWERGEPNIPADRVLEIERITGISRHELLPNLSRIFIRADERGAA